MTKVGAAGTSAITPAAASRETKRSRWPRPRSIGDAATREPIRLPRDRAVKRRPACARETPVWDVSAGRVGPRAAEPRPIAAEAA